MPIVPVRIRKKTVIETTLTNSRETHTTASESIEGAPTYFELYGSVMYWYRECFASTERAEYITSFINLARPFLQIMELGIFNNLLYWNRFLGSSTFIRNPVF